MMLQREARWAVACGVRLSLYRKRAECSGERRVGMARKRNIVQQHEGRELTSQESRDESFGHTRDEARGASHKRSLHGKVQAEGL